MGFRISGALPCANYAQTTATTTVTDYMSFIWKLMQTYPYDTVKLDNPPNVPNLAYEPYWKNVEQMTWDKKCKHCTEAFKRYKTVCAVDHYGDIHVNISMCGMLRQNCQRGVAAGRSSGRIFDYQSDVFVVADGWARFSLRQQEDAIITLSSHEQMGPPNYIMILDGWKEKKSCLYRDKIGTPLRTFWNSWRWDRPIGRKNEYVEFVVRWNSASGWILVTKSEYATRYNSWARGFYFNYTDPSPFKIKFIGITGNNHVGDWIIKGFIVSSMDRCAPYTGLAKPLPTNPTAVPPIIKSYSPINRNYFKRWKAVGVDPNNMTAPVTAEEY